jgi:nucleoid-associated protein EbfC
MLDKFEKMQEEMQRKLADITVEAATGEGAVTVTMTAALRVENIAIDPSKVNLTDTEQLEDLLLVAINDAIQKAQIKAAAESQKMMQNMIPGGLSALGGLFGK